jgi:mRNA interferase MazF
MTGSKRGDVVVVRYPNSDLLTYKKRPALVVQADDVDTGINQTVVALVTTNLRRTGPTRVQFNKASAEGRAMGLLGDSVVVTDTLPLYFTAKSTRSSEHVPSWRGLTRRCEELWTCNQSSPSGRPLAR